MKNRLISIILLTCTLLSLTACAKNDNAENTEREAPDYLINKRQVYPFDAEVQLAAVAVADDTALVVGQNGAEMLAKFYSLDSADEYDAGFTLINECMLSDFAAAGECEVKGACTADGAYYVLLGEAPRYYYNAAYELIENLTYQGHYMLLSFDETGNGLSQSAILLPQFDDVNFFAVADDGTAYVGGSAVRDDELVFSIRAVTPDSIVGNELSLPTSTQLCALNVAGDKLFISCYDYAGQRAEYYSADRTLSALSQMALDLPIDTAYSIGNHAQGTALNGAPIVSDAFCFLTVDAITGNSTLLMQWGFENQYETQYDFVYQIAENTFLCAERGKEYITLISQSPRPATPASVVRVAICGDRAAEMRGRVQSFAATSGEYDYQFTLYSIDDVSKFYSDMMAGNTADLVLFDNCISTNSQFFDDLYPYIDADPDLSRESFLPNLLSALEVNGELHELWTGVRLKTLTASTADCERLPFTTLSELANAAKQQGRPLFSAGYDLLGYAVEISACEYVDMNSGKCSFDDTSFTALLQNVKDYTLAQNEDNEYEQAVLQLRTFPVLQFIQEALSKDNESVELVSLPGMTSGGSYYVCGTAGRGVAIPRNSDNKAGAWAYIKSELTVASQLAQEYNISTTVDAFEREAAAVLSDENAQKVFNLLQSTTKAVRYSDTVLTDMLKTAIQAYISGDKTIEETVALIQSRASIYLAEQT